VTVPAQHFYTVTSIFRIVRVEFYHFICSTNMSVITENVYEIFMKKVSFILPTGSRIPPPECYHVDKINRHLTETTHRIFNGGKR
jgi:hypothetical protein